MIPAKLTSRYNADFISSKTAASPSIALDRGNHMTGAARASMRAKGLGGRRMRREIARAASVQFLILITDSTRADINIFFNAAHKNA